MSKLAFGLTMMIVGIGGTFLTLAILIWSIELLKRLFPLEPAQAPPLRQIFSLERIPPQWREKLPLETIRAQWNQRLAPLQRASVAWLRNQGAALKRIASQGGHGAIFSSVQARIFGRVLPASRPERGAAANRDQTRPS
jgi:Na+-transporting methylmalonyl-CoA/oxaloacetate decarboxylase gamma subunit